MVTSRAIAELDRWAEAAQAAALDDSEKHLRQFYHLGAALVASKEFQSAWQSAGHRSLAPSQLTDTCELLRIMAQVEADQVAAYGLADGR